MISLNAKPSKKSSAFLTQALQTSAVIVFWENFPVGKMLILQVGPDKNHATVFEDFSWEMVNGQTYAR